MKYFEVVLLFACVWGALSTGLFTQDFDDEWNSWKIQFKKTYDADNEMIRKVIWQKNVEKIVRHNLQHQRGLYTYRLGMNEFGDLTHDEFVSFHNGFKQSNISSKAGSTYLPPSNVEIPKSVDWRTKGYVTHVKNQKQCGSCWAFSTTGSLEGQHFKKTGILVSLSEQNLVDCSKENRGCSGGFMDRAFEYVKNNGGIDTEASYPYKAKDEKCKFSPKHIGATCTGYTDIKSGSEIDLTSAIATVGPISVAIDASQDDFQFYESGVYDDPYCSSTILDHGVLAVGYGVTTNGTQYYIVKNSWGTSWGMNGYIWMSRNKKNQCGIATNASYPLV